MADLIIHQGAIYSGQSWIDPGYLVIQDQVISQISPGEAPEELLRSASKVISAKHQAVIPGLTNGHTHLSQVFMRGLAGGKGLLAWLSEIVWPIQQVLSPEDMYLAARLGFAENIRCGVTDVVDHHKITGTPLHTDMVLKAADEAGVNFRLARSWSDLGKEPESAESILDDLSRLLDDWQDHPRIAIDSGPLALWRCSEKTLVKAHQMIKDSGRKTHFHVSETQDEVQMSLDEYGIRPVEWLNRLGVLDQDTEVVHGVWLDDREIEWIAAAGAPVVHCPVSNAVLGSGIAPLKKLLAADVEVRLGTDGPASNDTQDIWETMKFALSLARISTLDPTLLPPSQVLTLAATGKQLQQGAAADLIIVDMEHVRYAPIQDYSSSLVLSGRGDDVATVIAGGDILMLDRQLQTLDEADLLQEGRSRIQQIRTMAGLEA